MILIKPRPLANPAFPPPSSCLFFRESPGALHHGNEPVIDPGVSLPHDPPSPPAQTGFAEIDPEESYLPQQEFPGFAVGSGPAAEEKKENVSDPVTRGSLHFSATEQHAWCLKTGIPVSPDRKYSR